MNPIRPAVYWISLSVTSLSCIFVTTYLAMRLYSAFPLVGASHRVYLISVFLLLSGISIALLIPFAFKAKLGNRGAPRHLSSD